MIISVSRDKTIRSWRLLPENNSNSDTRIISCSGHWLNTLAYLAPNQKYPEGLVFAGGKDMIIEVRKPIGISEQNAEALLVGHSNSICALDLDPAGEFLVSGSWDNEARIWLVGKWECETILKGHEASVWAVLAFDSETIITGCADQKIRIFNKTGKLLTSIQASNAPVRALCRLHADHPSAGNFASADNEGIIRFWTLEGKQVGEAKGHESFIYSLASLPSGELISSGEDRTLRIWKGENCIQTITHPAVSVWSVAACAQNGDIVSGASDKIVRVFSRNTNRIADDEIVKYFENSVKGSSIPMQDIKKDNLPGPDFLISKSGTKDGQIQMIHEVNGSVTAHAWSSASGSWNLVGTVVDSVSSNGQKEVYNGQEYDFVFNVDMEDGKPPLKLPYNLSENPFEVAANFIKINEAPISYLDQVANFIIQNTRPTNIGIDQGFSTDRLKETELKNSVLTNSIPQNIIPQKDYLSITVARIPAIKKKIEELNSILITSNQKNISINPTELSVLTSLSNDLKTSSTAKISYPEIDLVLKITTKWHYNNRLPGLDLFRLMAPIPSVVTYHYPGNTNLVDILISGSTEQTPPAENHVMMAIRAFANLFGSAEGRKLALSEFRKIHDLVAVSILSTTNRNLLVASTTVYINYSVSLVIKENIGQFELTVSIIDTLCKILGNQTDSEVIYRALVALGTLVSLDDKIRTSAGEKFAALVIVEKAVSKASDPRIRTVGQEIHSLFMLNS